MCAPVVAVGTMSAAEKVGTPKDGQDGRNRGDLHGRRRILIGDDSFFKHRRQKPLIEVVLQESRLESPTDAPAKIRKHIDTSRNNIRPNERQNMTNRTTRTTPTVSVNMARPIDW